MIKYYFHKGRETLWSKIAIWRYGFETAPGQVLGIHGRNRFKYRHLIFDFSDNRLFHLGDQLFHLPIFASLANAGIPFSIVGRSALTPWFSAYGYQTRDSLPESLDGCFIVSKNDRLGAITRRRNAASFAFLGLDYARMPGGGYVCDLIASAIVAAFDRLQLPSAADMGHALASSPQSGIAVPEESRWPRLSDSGLRCVEALGKYRSRVVLVNPFVASSALQARARIPLMVEWARELRKSGHVLWLCGTHAERQRPASGIVYDDDVRGALTVTDLLWVLRQGGIEGVLCFDTFMLHAACLMGRNVRVVMKDAGRAALFRSRFVPMCEGLKRYVLEVR